MLTLQVMMYSRHQRRHNYFVLEHENTFLRFAPDGNNYGFVELKDANVFNHKKAEILKKAVQSFELNIRMLTKINGKLTAI